MKSKIVFTLLAILVVLMFVTPVVAQTEPPLKGSDGTLYLFNFTTGIGTEENPSFDLGCLYYATSWENAVFELAFSLMQLKTMFDSGFHRPWVTGVCTEGGYALGPWP